MPPRKDNKSMDLIGKIPKNLSPYSGAPETPLKSGPRPSPRPPKMRRKSATMDVAQVCQVLSNFRPLRSQNLLQVDPQLTELAMFRRLTLQSMLFAFLVWFAGP